MVSLQSIVAEFDATGAFRGCASLIDVLRDAADAPQPAQAKRPRGPEGGVGGLAGQGKAAPGKKRAKKAPKAPAPVPADLVPGLDLTGFTHDAAAALQRTISGFAPPTHGFKKVKTDSVQVRCIDQAGRVRVLLVAATAPLHALNRIIAEAFGWGESYFYEPKWHAGKTPKASLFVCSLVQADARAIITSKTTANAVGGKGAAFLPDKKVKVCDVVNWFALESLVYRCGSHSVSISVDGIHHRQHSDEEVMPRCVEFFDPCEGTQEQGPLRWNDDVHEVGSCLDLGDSFGQLWAWDCLNVRLKAGKQTKGYHICSAAWSDELIEMAQLHRMRKPFFVKGGGDVPHNYQDRHWRREFEAWHQAWLAQQPPPRKPVPKRALDNLESSAGFCHKYRLPSS